MVLKVGEIAKMFDLSCVRMQNTTQDIIDMVLSAKKYECGQVSVLQCFINQTKELLGGDRSIHIVGNVSFPSGSDDTELKVIQAKQMVQKQCDEIDMVLNVGWLKSGMFKDVEDDIAAVIAAVGKTPLKVIIESPLLNKVQIAKACEICVRTGATFVKTGTGWTEPTTLEQVQYIKSVVGDSILIKASGGVKNLDLLAQMYKSGASRFGVNLRGGLSILKECMDRGGSITV